MFVTFERTAEASGGWGCEVRTVPFPCDGLIQQTKTAGALFKVKKKLLKSLGSLDLHQPLIP